MTATPPEEDSQREHSAPDAPAKPKLRGLWSVMQPVEPVAEPSSEAATPPAPHDEEVPSPTRGLWAVMGSRGNENPVESPGDEESLEPMELVTDPGDQDTISITAEPTADDALGEEFQFDRDSSAPHEHRGRLALCLGIAAIPLAMSAWFGLLWTGIVAGTCSFAALLLAALEWTSSGTVHRTERLQASLGAVAGALSLVLGPFVFAPLGQTAREARSGRNTSRHLQQLGTALNQHHDQTHAYPAGGTIVRDGEGRSRGGHGWMAALLPFIGQQPLYQQIDFTHPYDEPVNHAAMSTAVVTFFAAGGNRAPNGGGYAVSHFAGVGGDVRNARGVTLPGGIFRSGSPLTQADISDGLATTFAAGELGGTYPAWGDPENMRVIQLGLNKDPRGFGNSARTGATMLFADGHVRFFPNTTDPEVLRRLTTRNAGDLTSGVE